VDGGLRPEVSHVGMLDTRLVQRTARIGAKHTGALSNIDSILSNEEMVSELRRRYADPGGRFDWALLGKETWWFSSVMPPLTLLSGAIGVTEARKQERQVRARREAVVEAEVVEPERVKQGSQTDTTNAKRHMLLSAELSKLMVDDSVASTFTLEDGSKVRRLPLLRVILDPWSLTQSVENMFYLSVLVGMQAARVELDRHGEPLLEVRAHGAPPNTTLGELRGTKQVMLGVDEDLWREGIKLYKLERPLLTHWASADSSAPPSFSPKPYTEPHGTSPKRDRAAKRGRSDVAEPLAKRQQS
jgi:hypothetical protein